MPDYLIGFGERLMQQVSIKSGGGEKRHPYTFDEARQALAPQLDRTIKVVRDLPSLACPGGEAVVAIALHPAYLAKSYFPETLLHETGLRSVGSRAVRIVPRKPMAQPGRKRNAGDMPDVEAQPNALPATAPEIFLAGSRDVLHGLTALISKEAQHARTADDVRKIEVVRPLEQERIRQIDGDDGLVPLEVVLHAASDGTEDHVIEGFRAWGHELGTRVNLDLRLQAGGLCFLPVRAPREAVAELSRFAFLRVLRRMPKLRMSDVLLRAAPPQRTFPVTLPTGAPLNPDVKVAVFDGGCPVTAGLQPWVKRLKTPGTGAPLPRAMRHGLGVTSAALFGPLRKGVALPVPWASVDHWRVIDAAAVADEGTEMYTVLRRIDTVLSQRQYDFVNLSLGPNLPIEDDEVHAWTAVIDQHLASGQTVLTNAVGNDGEADRDAGLARIQPSSDAVNGIGVGASDGEGAGWARAPYSSVGPGRSPGFVKPDLVTFGGGQGTNEFNVLDLDRAGHASGRCGTSFSSPYAMRAGIGIRAHFGTRLGAPAIKALLVHHADAGSHHRHDVGWGRLPSDLDRLVVCDNGEAHIVYQGFLLPSQWMRFPVPEPQGGFSARVTLRATFCFFTGVDPEDALNYTRAGLLPVFRPNMVDPPPPYIDRASGEERPRGQPPSARFFQSRAYYATEAQRRTDAHKWETTLREQKSFRPGQLKRPVFDVEYQARSHGRPAVRLPNIPYALVLSVIAPGEPDLYNRILTAYRNRLEVLRPIVEIPVSIRSSR